MKDPFKVIQTLSAKGGDFKYFSLHSLSCVLEKKNIDRLPISIKVLLEALLRNIDGDIITDKDVRRLADWSPERNFDYEVPFKPARVLLQDFTGVPAVVDLAALRDACSNLGGDPETINPMVPCDLVIDHSIQTDHFASKEALRLNLKKEFERNSERYEFLKWGQQAFNNFRVIPPGAGIVHQVNLEYLASCVQTKGDLAFPDSLVGTDSHTTMINSLGIVGWGVGGIEAEAVMLGQPVYMLTPEVVGVRLTGSLPEGSTATDLVLKVTEVLRGLDVVGQFVEFFGEGAINLSLPDRATLANMAPEYGATMGFFPVDDITLEYLQMTGRKENHIDLVEKYCKAQGLWRNDSAIPLFTRVVDINLSDVEPCLAGPKRPQDRIKLSNMKIQWEHDIKDIFGREDIKEVKIDCKEGVQVLGDGSIVIAAITSCTNTSNPYVMVAAGLVAEKAVRKGIKVKPWVKTSLAPGSRVVADYLKEAGLIESLEKTGFHIVGYGCTTCIGNSGPLPDIVAKAVAENDLVACAVLSGNRNFEGRIHPQVGANYLASPPLVVAYALAGTVDIDLCMDSLGKGKDGKDVFLKDIWPAAEEVRNIVSMCVKPEQFMRRYSSVDAGSSEWRDIPVNKGVMYRWPERSSYIQPPPFFFNIGKYPPPISPITGARALIKVGNSVTTDHISPAGAIPDGPASDYLMSIGIDRDNFNSFGSRRGNHEVMMRGTFANIRLKNRLAPGTQGGMTVHFPSGEIMYVWDASCRYKTEGVPLIVLAGLDYGMGSSRDWAAKGTYLLGIKAVIAESYERIHRSNLVGMGVLPLQFMNGDSADKLGITGEEIFDIGITDSVKPLEALTVCAKNPKTDRTIEFQVTCRIDTPVEIEYYRNRGILHTVLRKVAVRRDG